MRHRLPGLLALLVAFLVLAPAARAATFTVNQDGAGDGTCDGTCSLNDAILAANTNNNAPIVDLIAFAIGTTDIAPITATAIDEIVAVDGTLNAARVRIDGTGVVFAAGAEGSTVRGLAIGGAAGGGDAGIRVEADGVTIENTYLGLEPDGITPNPNDTGVAVAAGGSATIGGADPGDRNVISANNNGAQVSVDGTGAAARTVVEGNFLGTTASGAAVAVPPASSSDGVIAGGTNGPLIRDNVIAGVPIGIFAPGGQGTDVQGNLIGLSADGQTVLGVQGRAVWVDGGQIDIEPSPSRPNVIAGAQHGIWLDGAGAAGPRSTVRGNRIGTLADGTLAPAAGHSEDGIELGTNNAHRVDITGNTIAGSAQNGIHVADGDDVRIGGTTPAETNTITGNGDDGVNVANGRTDIAVLGNTITGNGGDELHRGDRPGPAITSATTSGGDVRLIGSLSGLIPGAQYRFDAYRPTTACEMRDAGGSVTVTANGAGVAAFDFNAPPRTAGQLVAVGATRLAGGVPADSTELTCATVVFQAPPAQPPGGAPPPAPEPPAPPPPDPGLGPVNAQTVSGTVRITLPNGQVVDPSELREIPLGSRVDATKGRVRIVGRTPTGPGDAVFYGGVFLVTRDPAGRIELRLQGALQCSAAKQPRRGRAAQARRRKLWGNGTGNFRVSGKHSAAVVRGTQWSVEDRCDGTLTEVQSGRVEVLDYALGVRPVIGAGRRYLAEDLPLPRRGRTVNLIPTGDGDAVVRLANGQTRTIDEFTQVPATTTVDASTTAVRLVTAGVDVTQAATFTQGAFRLAGQRGTTIELVLADRPAAPRARTAGKRRKAGAGGRKLWGDGEGNFRVSGKHSAAVVRGTRWLVQETAGGTLTRVARGVVSVEDFKLRRAVTVTAGNEYLAAP